MNKVLKKALGFAGALGLTAVMVLAAAPVQASDVDARIQVLERELTQLKQNQESALAAEMKGPSFKYSAGKGVTMSGADNNWSLTIGSRMQIYTSLWLTNDNPEEGYQNAEVRIRRFRPYFNVKSQQGFYALNWTINVGQNDSHAYSLGGDMYVNFDKLNPFLPSLGYGYNPSFKGNTQAGAHRTEDDPFLNALGLGGGQDGSVVLSWTKLPAMGISQITHLQLAFGHDEQNEAKQGDTGTDGRSIGFALGLKPLAKAKGMGGLNVSSVSYSFGYESLTDLVEGPGGISGATQANGVTLANVAKELGDHTYMSHGLSWAPLKWLSFSANFATYEADADSGNDIEASDIRLAANVWLWGPKSGMMGGSTKEGGISVAPLYSMADIDSVVMVSKTAEVSNSGLAVKYSVPGGWMQIHGVWDTLGCEGSGCSDFSAVADAGDDSFNVFTLIVDYKF